MSFPNEDMLSFSSPTFMPFIYFPLVLPRIFSTILNTNSKSEHPRRDPNLRGSIQYFISKSYVRCRFFINILYQIAEVPFYSSFS